MKQSSDATFYFDQSIGFMLFFIKKSLVFEKGFEPKKPRYEDSGDGWALLIIKCLELLIYFSYSCAFLPQRI